MYLKRFSKSLKLLFRNGMCIGSSVNVLYRTHMQHVQIFLGKFMVRLPFHVMRKHIMYNYFGNMLLHVLFALCDTLPVGYMIF